MFPGVKGWLRGKGPFETESAAGYSAALDQALRITHGMLQNASPDQSIPIALSCWSYLRAPSQNTADYRINFSKQDCFFHASQLNSIIRNSDFVSLAENGPLIGNLGLIQAEGDRIWGSAAYHLQKLYLDSREIVLKVATIRDKPMQAYSWSGIPGLGAESGPDPVHGKKYRPLHGSRIRLSRPGRPLSGPCSVLPPLWKRLCRPRDG